MNLPMNNLDASRYIESVALAAGLTRDELRIAVGGDVNVNNVELHMAETELVSQIKLLALKQRVSGLKVTDNPAVKPVPVLPAAVARAAGAIAIDGPSPVVAFIEDLPVNVETVQIELGLPTFDVWLMTATQFSQWWKALYAEESRDRRKAADSLAEVFDAALETNATDIHLSAGRPPSLRINGTLQEMSFQPLTDLWLNTEFLRLFGQERMARLETDRGVDVGYSFGNCRFRVNLGYDMRGMTAAIRRLPNDIPSFEDLGLPAAMRKFCTAERGLVLITGPVGSGKTSSLAAMLAHIAETESRHILTLEDPIEYTLPEGKSVIHQRELGQSFTSFASALRQSLRQDPDIVLVGEARDRETISACVTAAETGALVFATLHTYDAASTLGRIVSSYPLNEQDQVRAQLSHVLNGVVSQTLIPSTSGGRVAAFEILVSTAAVKNNLRKVDGLAQLRQVMASGRDAGMQTLETHLADLVRAGTITLSDAEYKARDLQDLRRLLGKDES